MLTTHQYLFLLLLLVTVIVSVWAKKLTIAGGIAGALIALAIYYGSGWVGITMLGAFFVLGTLASSFGKREKKKIGLDDNHGGQRTAGQVIANGGVAGVIGLLCFLTYREYELGIFLILVTMMSAALSSALADTLASELGTLYGKRFYNILTFRKDIRGENGVVSLEGTLIGVVGSCTIAVIHCVYVYWDAFWVIVIAGTIGNITDSILGATLERRGILKNNAVNLLNTIVAALTAFLLLVL